MLNCGATGSFSYHTPHYPSGIFFWVSIDIPIKGHGFNVQRETCRWQLYRWTWSSSVWWHESVNELVGTWNQILTLLQLLYTCSKRLKAVHEKSGYCMDAWGKFSLKFCLLLSYILLPLFYRLIFVLECIILYFSSAFEVIDTACSLQF